MLGIGFAYMGWRHEVFRSESEPTNSPECNVSANCLSVLSRRQKSLRPAFLSLKSAIAGIKKSGQSVSAQPILFPSRRLNSYLSS